MELFRAKMQIVKIDKLKDGDDVHLHAVGKSEYDQSGLDSDNSFSKFSPSAGLSIKITTPDLIGKLSLGKIVNVTFNYINE